MAELRLFEYAVILQPLEDKDGKVTDEGRLVVSLTAVLVADQAQAALLAGRSIPDEYLDRLSRLTVVVRPF